LVCLCAAYWRPGETAAAGKKENAIVEVDEISKPVEYVTDECAKTPKETVWKKVENYVKKATKKL